MAKKQFKLGELAIGGIIAVEVAKKQVVIKALDYNTKKEVRVCRFSEDQTAEMQENLWDMTSSYYTDKIMEWIRANIPVQKHEWA